MHQETSIVVVDMHCEATSESQAMGWYLDGRVSAVVGTHRHVQTADERLLPKGTAYITDLGMTGPTDSVIGVDPELALQRFLTQMPNRFEPAKGPAALHGVVIRIDPDTGRGLSIERLRVPSPPEPERPVLTLDGKAVAAKVLADVQDRRRRARRVDRRPADARGDPGRRGSRLPGVRAQQEAERRGSRHRLARLPLPAGLHAGGAARHHPPRSMRMRRFTASCFSSRCPRDWTRTRPSRPSPPPRTSTGSTR